MKQQPIFTQAQEDAIRAIVVAELKKVKAQIDAEISSDVKKLEEKLTAEKQKSELNQLAIVKKSDAANRELVIAAGQQIGNITYKRVMDEINAKIVPQINNVAQYVAYQMQDQTENITEYRRAVFAQATADDAKMLTNGDTRHVISEHVQAVFREDD